MAFSRALTALGAQLGIFGLGALGLLAATRELYATAGLCGLLALALTSMILMSPAFRANRGRAREAPPGATFTAELSRRRLQVLLDQTPSPLLLENDNGQIVAVNRAARRLFDAAYALPASSRKALLDGAETLLASLCEADGQLRWRGATYAASLTELSEDDRSAHLVVLTDISAEVRAAEATALRDLLRVLNHELMNALTPVASMSKSALDLLAEDTPQARSAARKALERVVARTDGLSDFIGSYRALTQLPKPDLRPVDLAVWLDVVRESFAAQWESRGVRAEYVTPQEPLSALIDEDQMWLCVGNLMNNAAQAALERSDPRVRLTLIADATTIHCRLEDSGAGVPADQIDKVFMPFFTTKSTGTGVGLSLSRQIVQAHGSALTLSRPDSGSSDRLGGAVFEFQWKRAGSLPPA